MRRVIKLASICNDFRLNTQGPQGIGNTAQIARAVINQGYLHSASLVLGIPLTLGSISQASRNARASPLNTASAMW